MRHLKYLNIAQLQNRLNIIIRENATNQMFLQFMIYCASIGAYFMNWRSRR